MARSRRRLRLVAAFAVATAAGCGGGGSDGSGSGSGGPGGAATLSWFTSSCSDLGGVLAPLGACYVRCGSWQARPYPQCPPGTECVGYDYGDRPHFCGIVHCNTDADCGPGSGWVCRKWSSAHPGDCTMRCSPPGSGDAVQSAECPEHFGCFRDTFYTPAQACGALIQTTTGPSCGEPCPSGCCSDSGLICCQPPFCGGDCSSSPCCM